MHALFPASRRAFLTGSVATAAALWAGGARSVLAADRTTSMGLKDAVAAIKGKRLTATAHTQAMLARIASHKSLNAYIATTSDLALAQAKAVDTAIAAGRDTGPIAGAVLAIKDNIDVKGVATTAGTPGLKKNIPGGNAPVAQAVIAAGGIVAGKANMHELAFGITSNNAAFGPARNPYNTKMIPGGSSGGTAVAVAARLATAGLGSDTGGSCRIPAALCGVVGFRPTLLRYSQAGVVPISSTRDTPGPFARSVADAAMLDQVCASKKQAPVTVSLKGLRLGVPRGYFYEGLDSELAKVVDDSLGRLKKAGAVLVEADIPDLKALNDAVSFPVALYEVLRELSAYLYLSGSKMSVREIVEQVAGPGEKGILGSQLDPKKAIPAAAYQAAMGVHRPKLQAAYAEYFKGNNIAALVVPTTPLPARPIGQDETVELNGKKVPTFPSYIRNTDPPSNAGLPCLSVPAGLTASGLPVGIEFVGPANSDNRLLAVGSAFEGVRPPMPAPKI